MLSSGCAIWPEACVISQQCYSQVKNLVSVCFAHQAWHRLRCSINLVGRGPHNVAVPLQSLAGASKLNIIAARTSHGDSTLQNTCPAIKCEHANAALCSLAGWTMEAGCSACRWQISRDWRQASTLHRMMYTGLQLQACSLMRKAHAGQLVWVRSGC